jgi:2-polyprenyl-6-hydroxyphenyl methylase/3-demethylubiquinone-9 3-methyltransferase
MTTIENVDELEIQKFEAIAAQWWDPTGNFKPLHQLNPVRLNYIEQGAEGLFDQKILDVGCGGGILSESMAVLGAKVTGIDMGERPLAVAKKHAHDTGVDVRYLHTTAEQHAQKNQATYDVITCMEMLEHVPDPASVIAACERMLKPGGVVFFSTINRNAKAFIQAIVGAEYVLRMLPKGTHQYEKLIKPSELIAMIEATDLQVTDATGVTFSLIKQVFETTESLDVNYMLMAQKD